MNNFIFRQVIMKSYIGLSYPFFIALNFNRVITRSKCHRGFYNSDQVTLENFFSLT